MDALVQLFHCASFGFIFRFQTAIDIPVKYGADTDAEMALMQTNLGSKSDNTADNTRKVAEELAGKEGHK